MLVFVNLRAALCVNNSLNGLVAALLLDLATHYHWMMLYLFIVASIKYSTNIASCCNDHMHSEHFQYRPTLHSYVAM